MPGMVLSGVGISGSPTLVNCTLNCGSATAIAGANSTMDAEREFGSISSEAMRADYPQTGGTPWPTFNFQTSGALPFGLAGFGTELVKAGTFKLSVNGTVVCQDSQTFAYNNTGETAQAPGSRRASSTIRLGIMRSRSTLRLLTTL